jgi:hypothetical protein
VTAVPPRRPQRRLTALAVAAVVATGCASTGEPAQTAAVEARPVDADGLSQTVVPAADGFSRVTVTTATFGATEVDGLLELTVAGAGVERRAAAAGADLRDNAPVTFAFPPVPEAAGERFTLTFTYRGRGPLALYANPHDPYRDGALADGDGDLVFVLGHADRLAGAADALGRVADEAGDKAGSDLPFTAVWLALLAAAAALAVHQGRRRQDL